MSTALTIHTSATGWAQTLAKAYKSKTPIVLVDDAAIGVNPVTDTILDMGRKANLSIAEWIAVVTALGVAAAGAYLLVMAILDPEPFSKITFAIGAGAVLIAGGGGSAIAVLTNRKPPNVKFNKGAFEICWE